MTTKVRFLEIFRAIKLVKNVFLSIFVHFFVAKYCRFKKYVYLCTRNRETSMMNL